MNFFYNIFAGSVLAACSIHAVCSEGENKLYFGAGLGYSNGNLEQIFSDAQQTNSTASLTNITSSNIGVYRAFIGYQLNQNAAIEIGYLNSSKKSIYFRANSVGSSVSSSIGYKYSGLEYSMLFRPNVDLGFEHFFARLGGTYFQANYSSSDGLLSYSPNGTGWVIGFGYDYPVYNGLIVRAEYLNLRKIAGEKNNKLNNIGLDLIGSF